MTPKKIVLLCWLLLCSIATAQASSTEAAYDQQSHRLNLPVVLAGTAYWSAELLDTGNYQFQLGQVTPYTGIIPAQYPIFNKTSGQLRIPSVSALGKTWAITLQQTSTGFSVSDSSVISESVSLLNSTTPPKERYVINNDGTVNDKETGLQWMRCSLGQTWDGKGCTGNLLVMRAQQAAREAYESRFAGHADWRLPTVDELKTLVYCSSGNPVYWNTIGQSCQGNYQKPTLYFEAFPDTPAAVYWTMTQLQRDPGEDYNLTVSFNYGHVYYSYFSDAYEAARFVRGTSNIVPGPEYIGGFKE